MKILVCLLLLLAATNVFAQPQHTNLEKEVIYSRKDGMALTLLVLQPAKPNGKAVVSIVSGGWNSVYNSAVQYYIKGTEPFTKAGYTVFLTMHGSNPRYTIPDAVSDIKKAVQFVRYSAATYSIDPNNIAITGTSSGGHLALLVGMSEDVQQTASFDVVEKVSSKVQSVIAFCPMTDFLNFGSTGASINLIKKGIQQMGVWGAFSYTKWDMATKTYQLIHDEAERRTIDSLVSPIYHISPTAPPVYIVHGNADKTVPIQQSQLFVNQYKAAGFPATFIVKQGIDHNLVGLTNADFDNMILWLNKINAVQ